jgi:hypothetical protein
MNCPGKEAAYSAQPGGVMRVAADNFILPHQAPYKRNK